MTNEGKDLTETDRMLAERACERLIALYGHLIDGGEAARVADLFTADGVWTSPEARMDGREAIRDGFTRRQANVSRRSRHVCTNVVVEVVSPDVATGRCYFTLFRADGIDAERPAFGSMPAMVGDYVDRFVRTSDGWRFAHRNATVAFLEARHD